MRSSAASHVHEITFRCGDQDVRATRSVGSSWAEVYAVKRDGAHRRMFSYSLTQHAWRGSDAPKDSHEIAAHLAQAFATESTRVPCAQHAGIGAWLRRFLGLNRSAH